MDWMNPEDALRYLGLRSIEDLEDVVIDMGLSVRVDDEGELAKIGSDGIDEALVAQHRRRVGFHPSDERWAKQAAREMKLQEDREAKLTTEHTKRLAMRIKKRREVRSGGGTGVGDTNTRGLSPLQAR